MTGDSTDILVIVYASEFVPRRYITSVLSV
jgi:hypothetical protein